MSPETTFKLARALGMSFCHPRYCACGKCSGLLFIKDSDADVGMNMTSAQLYSAIALPDWANGADPSALYEWAQRKAWQNRLLMDRMIIAGMRIYRRFE